MRFPSRRATPWLVSVAFYAAFAICQTWPLVIHLSSVIPHDPGDPILIVWVLWWNAHAVPLTSHWWNAPMFWPATGAFAFSETMLGLTPLTNPIQWLGGNPITAYNVAFLLTFPLSALAMHLLVFRLSARHDVAFVAGLIFGFNPLRIAHAAQLQVMVSWWMPLALYALHEFLIRRQTRWLVLFGIAWVMQALSNGYYLLFFPLLVGIWILWFTVARDRVRPFVSIVTAWAAASLILLPYLWEYRHILGNYAMHRGHSAGDAEGADLTGLLDASELLKFWKVKGFHHAEGELFPGVTAAVLAFLLMAIWLWRRRGATVRAPRARRVLAVLGGVLIAASLSTVWFGPWSIRASSVTLLSLRSLERPVTAGILLVTIALVLDPAFISAWRRRSATLFYLLATALMYLLSFGPQPLLMGSPFLATAPYAWLLKLPGFDDVRVPSRFSMLAVLCLSVVAALSLWRLLLRIPPKAQAVVVAVVVAGVLVDSWIEPLPLRKLPDRWHTLEALPPETAVLELPIGQSFEDLRAMYRGMFHGRPVMNGYSGFFPRSAEALSRGLSVGDAAMFDAITAWGPVAVAVDETHEAAGRWIDQMTARSGTVSLGSEAGRRFFVLAAGTPPGSRPAFTRLPLDHVSTNVNERLLPLALDGNLTTRWESGPQRGVESVAIDLGTPRVVDGIEMALGPHPGDFPRTLVVETSLDGESWSLAWQGRTAALAFAGAVREPASVPVTVTFAPASARWVRLRQIDVDPVFYWSIGELRVSGK